MIGENPDRPGLRETPRRFADYWVEFIDYADDNTNTTFESVTIDQLVVVKGMRVLSICEHHLLPFHGKAHVAYLPRGKIVGLSKLARVVEAYSRRLQVQERLTQQIARCIQETLHPEGVAVVIEAFHLCMAMRGVEKQTAYMTTSTLLGAFRNDERTRQEFFSIINKSNS